MRLLTLVLMMLCFCGSALADDPAAAHDPGGFYKFLHSIAPETAVKVWRGGDRPDLQTLLTLRGFTYGSPLYLRIFKEEGVIEAWLKKDDRYQLFEVYPICVNSGALGPKTHEGDGQAPEGFYAVSAKQLNPNSHYHRAMNMGYPNAYDKAQGRTGGNLMIHGACASIGCYALTDANIEEVYGLAQAALNNGETDIPIHAFPFRMTQENIIKHKDSEWIDFWVNELLPAYQVFDVTGIPPNVMSCDDGYEVMDGLDSKAVPKACTPITGWK